MQQENNKQKNQMVVIIGISLIILQFIFIACRFIFKKLYIIDVALLISIISASVYYSYFYMVYHVNYREKYKLNRKEQLILIEKLKDEKEKIEKVYLNAIQLNKEMTFTVRRLIENQKNLKEKNTQLINLFEVSKMVSPLNEIDKIIEVILERQDILIFNRISILFYNINNVLDYVYVYGVKCNDENKIINQSVNNLTISYQTKQHDESTMVKIAIPIVSDNRCDGVAFFYINTKLKTEESIEYIISLLNIVTIAIKNARFYQNIVQQKNEIERLYEQSSLMNEKLKLIIDELNKSKFELENKNKQLNDLYYDTILALTRTIEYKDKYTKGHCERVANIADKIAEHLNLSSEERDILKLACLLHDIGKIGVDENILNKKGKLDLHEFEEVKKHPLVGYDILKDLDFMERVKNVILQHHERVDGSGYPFGLKDQEIDLLAKILAGADAYDAMTSDRPYRSAFDKDFAVKELKKNSNRQFDNKIVDALLYLAKQGIVMFL